MMLSMRVTANLVSQPLDPGESPLCILGCMPGARRIGQPSKPLAITIIATLLFIAGWVALSHFGLIR